MKIKIGDKLTWAEQEIDSAITYTLRHANIYKDPDLTVNYYRAAFEIFKILRNNQLDNFLTDQCFTILKQLTNDIPLSPIEDTPDIWMDVSYGYSDVNNGKDYQCMRYMSLFKRVQSDGVTMYSDQKRVRATYEDDQESTFHSSRALILIN